MAGTRHVSSSPGRPHPSTGKHVSLPHYSACFKGFGVKRLCLGCDLHPPGQLPSPLLSHHCGDLLSTAAKTSWGTEDCASRSWSVPRTCSYNFSFCRSRKELKGVANKSQEAKSTKRMHTSHCSTEVSEKAPLRISSIMIMAHTPS